MQSKKSQGLCTTTTGKRSDGMPPGGKEKSLFKRLFELSGHSPLGRYDLAELELLELAMLPFPKAFEGSIFMSEIFLTFFS